MKLLVLTLLLMLCVAGAKADATAGARTAIAAQYDRLDTAAMASDATIYRKISTPDCRFLQSGQPASTVAQLEALMTQTLPQWRGMKTHTVINAVTVTGHRALVTNTQTTDGAFNGQALHDVTVNKDTWTQTPQGWRLRLSQVVSDKMTPGTLPPAPKENPAVLAQLKTAAVPLTTVQAGQGFADLAPFGAAVGDAQIVALGEASHGTREFFQMKHRLLEYLVTQKNFTVFAMEANWPETQAVDRYIKTGQGDPKAALAGLYFWTWNTQEVLDLIEWMRAYNAKPGPHPILSFTGFDMQTPDVALTLVNAYLEKVSPSEASAARKDYAPLQRLMAAQIVAQKKTRTGFLTPPSASVTSACRQGTEAVVARLDTHRAALVQASSVDVFEEARQNAVIVQQAAWEMTASAQEGGELRDKAMASNVHWLSKTAYPGQKIVLWAHNGHVGDFDMAGHRAMGVYLRRDYGHALYILGFAFDRGELRAVPMTQGKMHGRARPLPVPPAGVGTGDDLLHQAGLPLFFLDFQAAPPGTPLGDWLAAPHPFQMPGAAWDPAAAALFAQNLALKPAYDGLLYVDESHASVALPFPKRVSRH